MGSKEYAFSLGLTLYLEHPLGSTVRIWENSQIKAGGGESSAREEDGHTSNAPWRTAGDSWMVPPISASRSERGKVGTRARLSFLDPQKRGSAVSS